MTTNFDLNDFLAEFQPNREVQQKTSDEFAADAKLFMLAANINLQNVKEKSYQIIGNALRDITLPPRNHILKIRTQTQFSMIAFVLKIVEIHKIIDELTIATYTLNQEAFCIIADLVRSGIIKKLNFLIASSYSFRDNDHKQFMVNSVRELASNGFDVHLVFVWSHFKITLAKCNGNHYLIEGSMNYSTNNMAEQVVFENSEESYNFDYGFIIDIMSSTNNQSVEKIC